MRWTSTSSVQTSRNLLPHTFPVRNLSFFGSSFSRAGDHSCFLRRMICSPFASVFNTPPSATRFKSIVAIGTRALSQVLNHFARKLTALHLRRPLHEPGEIVGDGLR